MKKSLLLFAAAGLLSSGLTSCYKQTEYPNSVVGTIDSIAYNASGDDRVIFHVDTSIANRDPQTTVITSKTKIYTPGTTTQPAITIVVPLGVGTYSVPSQAQVTVVTSATGSAGTQAVSGYITVAKSAASHRFEGVFSVTCADGTTVTNGGFNGVNSYY